MQKLHLPIAANLMSGVISTAAHSAGLSSGATHKIVPVHGAIVEQSIWKPVADILIKKG